jgi:hypothetical protein
MRKQTGSFVARLSTPSGLLNVEAHPRTSILPERRIAGKDEDGKTCRQKQAETERPSAHAGENLGVCVLACGLCCRSGDAMARGRRASTRSVLFT